jgi:hypothetical protein
MLAVEKTEAYPGMRSCPQPAPNCVASNALLELLIGKAVFHRRSPMGGWAYGTPRKVLTLSVLEPLRMPDVVETRGTREDTLAAELEANRKEAKNVAKVKMNIMVGCVGFPA